MAEFRPDSFWHGGDYNPEQWPEEVWAEDMKLFKEAGIDTLTINIFSWAALQPSEDEYRFEKLDEIVKTLQDTFTEQAFHLRNPFLEEFF